MLNAKAKSELKEVGFFQVDYGVHPLWTLLFVRTTLS